MSKPIVESYQLHCTDYFKVIVEQHPLFQTNTWPLAPSREEAEELVTSLCMVFHHTINQCILITDDMGAPDALAMPVTTEDSDTPDPSRPAPLTGLAQDIARHWNVRAVQTALKSIFSANDALKALKYYPRHTQNQTDSAVRNQLNSKLRHDIRVTLAKLHRMLNQAHRRHFRPIDEAFRKVRYDPLSQKLPWLRLEQMQRIHHSKVAVPTRVRATKDGPLTNSLEESARVWRDCWSTISRRQDSDPRYCYDTCVATAARLRALNLLNSSKNVLLPPPRDSVALNPFWPQALSALNAQHTHEHMSKLINSKLNRHAASSKVDGCSPQLLQKGYNAYMGEALSTIFNACMRYSVHPSYWDDIGASPIYKREDVHHPPFYRVVTGMPLLRKVYVTNLTTRVTHFIEELTVLHDSHQGFRDGIGPEHCQFVLTTAVELTPVGKRVYVCFIDIKKAFPTTSRDRLFITLHDMGIRGPMLATLQDMYRDIRMTIKVPGSTSDKHSYPLEEGLLEGDPSSPFLYVISIDVLVRKMAKLGLGAHVAYLWLAVLMFADDLLLITYDPIHLQKLLDVLASHAHKEGRFQINNDAKDTCVMIMPPLPEGTPTPTWTCGDIVIHVKPYYKYLGVIREASGTYGRHFQKIVSMTGMTARKMAEWGCVRGKLDIATSISILKSCLMPQITYCMTTWYSPATHETVLNDIIYTRFCTLLVFPREHGVLPPIILFRELNVLDATALHQQQMMRLYRELYMAGSATTAGKLFRITDGVDWDKVNPKAFHPTCIGIARQLGLPMLNTQSSVVSIPLGDGTFTSNPDIPVWPLGDRPDRICTDWRDITPALTDKNVWKEAVMRAVIRDQQTRMDRHIGSHRPFSSRFLQQKRLLALETPESTARRMKDISCVPLVLGARLSILNIADHAGRYNNSAMTNVSACPRCLALDTIETLDHVFWECSTHLIPRTALYATMHTIWPLFTASLRDATQKSYFLLGCNMPFNIPPSINEDPAMRLSAMRAANCFLQAAAIHPVKPSLRQRWD